MKLVKPMLLGYQEEAGSEEGWLYEPKFNGFRLISGNNISYTRHGTITTSLFPELLFGGSDVLLDGELIAPGINSPDNFEGAMSRFQGNKDQPISLMAFDILSLKKKSIMHYPLEERKAILTETLAMIDSPYINLIPYVITEGEQLFNVIKENNMEGMVAKRLGTAYIPGTRSNNWRKIINWNYHDVSCVKIARRPLMLQLVLGNRDVGSVTIGFTAEMRNQLLSMHPPFFCKVKARGWTKGGKLRLPQLVKIYK